MSHTLIAALTGIGVLILLVLELFGRWGPRG